MNKNNIWVIYFVGALFIFFILATHYLKPYYEHRTGYDYSYIIKHLYVQVDMLTYGDCNHNSEKYQSLKRTITKTINTINDNYIELEKDYRNNEYNFTEYYEIKNKYKQYLNNLKNTLNMLESKVK